MKNVILYLISFLLLCSIVNYSIDYSLGRQINKQSPYYLSFASIGAISLESRMDSWAKIRTASTAQELEVMMEEILQCFDLPPKKNGFAYEKNKNSIILRYEFSWQREKYSFALESDKESDETYLILSMASKEKEKEWQSRQKKLNSLLGLDWNTYFLYTAALETILDSESRELMLNVVFKNLKAKKADTYMEENICSITGYSSILEKSVPSIEAGGKKYNVQAAIRTNFREGKSYVYIGSPLILGDY